MDIEGEKPRKIFHFDNIPNYSKTSEQQYFQQNWKVIQQTIALFLLGTGDPSSIIKMTRSLQIILNRNKYSELHQNLIKLFYQIFKQVIVVVSQQSNCLLSLLAYYINKKQHYRILFDLLNSYLLIYSLNDRTTIEQKAYQILCKQIINSHLYQKVSNELMNIIQIFRTTHDHNQIFQIQYQLKVISLLGIYQYCDGQFLEKSKIYFICYSQRVAKSQDIFNIIDQALKRETALNKLLKPSENSVRYLQKQLIQQYYPFMIQYMDYLIQMHKFDKLKMLWSYSLRLTANDRELLEIRLKQIIKDAAIYIKQENAQLFKILQFMQKMNTIIVNCFDSSKTISNLLHNTIQQILNENQKQYNQILSKKIFHESTIYSQQIIYRLFRLIPNKQRFIKQFQIRFFRWILNQQLTDISYQQHIIQIIKKECGVALCKNIERMIYDIWRDEQMLYFYNSSRNFKCRLLSNNQWPKFSYQNIVLPDVMKEIINQFQREFKKSPENNAKQLTWINEFGTVQLSINGTTSLFSQFQTAIIFILDRSIRPMKKDQLAEIVQGNPLIIASIVDELHSNCILEFNEMNQTYELNDSNSKPYRVVKEQKQNMEEIKTLSKRDDTILIEAAVVRILKKKKMIMKTDLTKSIYDYIRNFKPTLEQINQSLQKLAQRDFIQIDKTKGTLRYRE